MPILEEKIKIAKLELRHSRARQDSLQEFILEKEERLNSLLAELNVNNMENPAWLFLNPDMPGVTEKIQEYFNQQYGGLHNGVCPISTFLDSDGNPIQKNFEIVIPVYRKIEKKDEIYKNCVHFMENFLGILKPVMGISSQWNDEFADMHVVPFLFSSKDRGLNYLGYNPEDSKWYHFTFVHGNTDIKRSFDNFESAFNFAFDF